MTLESSMESGDLVSSSFRVGSAPQACRNQETQTARSAQGHFVRRCILAVLAHHLVIERHLGRLGACCVDNVFFAADPGHLPSLLTIRSWHGGAAYGSRRSRRIARILPGA